MDKEFKILPSQVKETFDNERRPMVLSVKPRFSKKILREEKTIELRKVFPTEYKGHAIIYESSPEKRVSGLIKIEKVRSMRIKELADLTEKTKVSESFVADYFDDRKRGYAISIGGVVEFEEKITLKELREKINFSPPQNYKYVRDDILRSKIEDETSIFNEAKFSGRIFGFLKHYVSRITDKITETTTLLETIARDKRN